MKKPTLDHESLGEYLRSIREGRNLSLREACKGAGISSAYLSQLEGGKRGKRKSEDEHFGPHPQILKRLANVYHVPASDLMRRAGYLEDDRSDEGFSEERETERVFDFVIRDPIFRKALSTLDKRAIVNRYEAITGKRLITWAGEHQVPTAYKSEYNGIVHNERCLYAETPHTTLTLDEVASELASDREQIERMIENHWLEAEKDAAGNLVVEKQELRQFKDYAMHDGLRMRVHLDKSERPDRPEDYRTADKLIEERETAFAVQALKKELSPAEMKTIMPQNARLRFATRGAVEKVAAKYKLKGKKK